MIRDADPPEGAKRCTKCGRVKPLDAFYRMADRPAGRHSWCKVCIRLARALHGQTEACKARRREYNARPEIRARERERERRNAAKRAAYHKEYDARPLSRLLKSLRQARHLLGRAKSEPRRRALGDTITALQAEIKRVRSIHLHGGPDPRKTGGGPEHE